MGKLQPVLFNQFGGLRLDQPIDEIGAENASYLADVDWEGSLGTIKTRDGFVKLNSSEASGTYKALFPHSRTRLLATKRVSSESLKLVALASTGSEAAEASLNATPARATFARFGSPSASYTYMRTNTASQKVVRFDGSTFTEPTATVDGEASKEMPKGALMATWASQYRLVTANTGTEGGPNKAASSASHVWFSEPGNAEGYESTAYVQLSPGDGEEITAMCTWNEFLFVFKETRAFVFWGVNVDEEGNPEFPFREISLGEGARIKATANANLEESSDSLAVSNSSGVYFCTTDGVYRTNSQSAEKISGALKPLEENVPFEGPMAEFLDGSTESARWPASGIASLDDRLFVKRYEYLFVYDIPLDSWTVWKVPNVSLTVWTGLSGGGSDAILKSPGTAASVTFGGSEEVGWEEPSNATGALNETYATQTRTIGGPFAKHLRVTNLGLGLPEAATVTGLKVSVTLYAQKLGGTSALFNTISFYAIKSGLVVTGSQHNDSGTVGEAPEVRTQGGSEDLWGTTWTPAQLNASNTGFQISLLPSLTGSGASVKGFVDGFTVTVFYTIPESSGGLRPRLFVSSSKHVYYTEPGAAEQLGTRAPAWQSGAYDLGSASEKELHLADAWGTGDVEVSVGRNFKEPAEPTTFELGEELEPDIDQKNLEQSGTLFTHRFSGDAPWSIQRFTRYLRVVENPDTRRATEN